MHSCYEKSAKVNRVKLFLLLTFAFPYLLFGCGRADIGVEAMGSAPFKNFQLKHDEDVTCLRISENFHPVLLDDGSLRINFNEFTDFTDSKRMKGFGKHIAIIVAHKNQAQQLGAITFLSKKAKIIDRADALYVVQNPPMSSVAFLKDELISVMLKDLDVSVSIDERMNALSHAVKGINSMTMPCDPEKK